MSKFVEEWRPVKDYEVLYEVSDWGNVRSLDRTFEYYHPAAKKNIRRTFKGITLKKVLNADGYHVVTLSDENHKQHEGKVHRLVAEAFLPNPENKPVVGHTKTLPDGTEDKTANEAWHIQWMTIPENANYGTLPQRLSEARMGDKNPNYGKSPSEETKQKMSEVKKVLWVEHPEYFENLKNSDKHVEKNKIKINQYNLTGDFIKTWDSAADAERELGVYHSNIAACCRGKIKSCGGYKWKYYE
jgi:hypothetical protein